MSSAYVIFLSDCSNYYLSTDKTDNYHFVLDIDRANIYTSYSEASKEAAAARNYIKQFKDKHGVDYATLKIAEIELKEVETIVIY